jgi:hypothetical protein
MQYLLTTTLTNTGQGAPPLTGTVTFDVSADPRIDEPIPTTATSGAPLVMNFPFPSTGLKFIYFICDRNITLTFKNAANTSVGTLVLKAGIAGIFKTGDTALVSAAVNTISAVFDTNDTATAGRLQGVVGYDVTP